MSSQGKYGIEEKRVVLEAIYKRYHRKKYIQPDPLQFLNNYPEPGDREIAGLIASSLAMGRVHSILNAVSTVLSPWTGLKEGILSSGKRDFIKLYRGFKYRFFNGEHIVHFLLGIKGIIREYGSLQNCFLEGLSKSPENMSDTQCHFVRSIQKAAGGDTGILLPDPGKKSACKRLNLFLRWMVRKDRIDPGGWDSVSPGFLIIPLDTHMLKAAKILGLTERKQGDITTAREITGAFSRISPGDPVRYDFSLTRMGIHPGLNFSRLKKEISSYNGNGAEKSIVRQTDFKEVTAISKQKICNRLQNIFFRNIGQSKKKLWTINRKFIYYKTVIV